MVEAKFEESLPKIELKSEIDSKESLAEYELENPEYNSEKRVELLPLNTEFLDKYVWVNPNKEAESRMCNSCPKSFDSKSELMNHFMESHTTIFHFCKICCNKLKSLKHLDQHLKIEHKEEGLPKEYLHGNVLSRKGQNFHTIYNCDLCIKKPGKSSMLILQQHMEVGHTRVHCRCKSCGKLFPNHLKATQHFSGTHRKRENWRAKGSYREVKKCPLCGKNVGEIYMRRHIKDRHKIDPESIIPSQKKEKDYTEALKYMKMLDKNTFQCKFCDEILKNSYSTARHLEIFHLDRRREKKSYEPKNEFKEFLITKSEIRETFNYKCLICKASFHQRDFVSRHLISSHGITDSKIRKENFQSVSLGLIDTTVYSCKACEEEDPKKFYNLKYFRIHARNNHLPSAIEGIVCSQCGAKFKNKWAFQDHEKRMHSDLKYFKCDICSKKFLDKETRKQHMSEQHPNCYKSKVSNLLKCPLCGKLTRMKILMRFHYLNIHKNVKALTCRICGDKFGDKNPADKHARYKHQSSYAKAMNCDLTGSEGFLKHCEKVKGTTTKSNNEKSLL